MHSADGSRRVLERAQRRWRRIITAHGSAAAFPHLLRAMGRIPMTARPVPSASSGDCSAAIGDGDARLGGEARRLTTKADALQGRVEIRRTRLPSEKEDSLGAASLRKWIRFCRNLDATSAYVRVGHPSRNFPSGQPKKALSVTAFFFYSEKSRVLDVIIT